MSEKILDSSNNIYKDLYKSGNPRFKNLPNHHRNQSNWLKKEHDNQIKSYYRNYKRGAIVFVEFGVNIGHELSGGHFAIVLNKNDNKRNSILNVVPLSSKSKKYYLNIDKTVFENAANTLKAKHDDFMKDYEEKERKKENLSSEINEIDDSMTRRINELRNSHNEDYKDEIDKLGKDLITLEEKVDDIVSILNELTENKKQIEEVYLKYSKFDKNTYACYQSVTPVSKLKIRRINKYDPSGTMKVDNGTLDKIDQKIIEFYTN